MSAGLSDGSEGFDNLIVSLSSVLTYCVISDRYQYLLVREFGDVDFQNFRIFLSLVVFLYFFLSCLRLFVLYLGWFGVSSRAFGRFLVRLSCLIMLGFHFGILL